MQRFALVDPDNATGQTKELLGAVKDKLGLVPKTFQMMANAPAVLNGYLSLMGALDGGMLPFETRNQIAIAVSEINKCPYCLSAFTAIGKGAGISKENLHACRTAGSDDPKVAAALKLAQTIVTTRGQVTDADIEAVRKAGYSEGEVEEIIANVAQYTFISYINLVSGTDIDFPLVTPGK